jgi:glucan biosynthesis protein C
VIVERQHYIDWVRVLAFSLLIFFHCAMPFVVFDWEIKNPETSKALSRFIWWLHQWRLPLLFFISGVGIHFSLRRRTIRAFIGERFVRLFIPLLFAMFFTIPLQVYFERLQRGKFHGSYWDFYPSVWSLVPYPEGTLTWSHMWFVAYLFVFCLLLLPVFSALKKPALADMKEKLASKFSHPLLLLTPAIPLIAYYFTLFLKYPEQLSLLDDWFVFCSSLTLLAYGYFLGGSPKFWDCCERNRFLFLGIAAACIAILTYGFWWNLRLPKAPGDDLRVYGILNSLHVWTLILALLGFAKRHLNFANGFLAYANQAVYPFYILHQTIIVTIGFYVVQWPLPVPVKLCLLVLLCFPVLTAIYQFIVRPFAICRLLFGLKLTQRETPGNPGDLKPLPLS